eukprot:932177-Pleurochrysis_carterae.AAC.1
MPALPEPRIDQTAHLHVRRSASSSTHGLLSELDAQVRCRRVAICQRAQRLQCTSFERVLAAGPPLAPRKPRWDNLPARASSSPVLCASRSCGACVALRCFRCTTAHAPSPAYCCYYAGAA